jgi:iron-sulfur cluster assembly protein
MINFTDSAIKQLKTILKPTESARVAVKGGGCSGMSYSLDISSEYDEEDLLLEFDHVKVYVDPHSAAILTETVVDFVQMGLNEGFVFNNSKANTTCGCGMSFS